MHLQLAPFLNNTALPVNDVDKEIRSVVNILIDTARDCLPSIKFAKRKFILEHELIALCKLSKIA